MAQVPAADIPTDGRSAWSGSRPSASPLQGHTTCETSVVCYTAWLGIIGELLPACYKLARQLHSTEDYIRELEEARKKLEAENDRQADALVERGLDQTILQAQLEEAPEQIEDLLEWQQRAQRILNRLPQEVVNSLPSRTREQAR